MIKYISHLSIIISSKHRRNHYESLFYLMYLGIFERESFGVFFYYIIIFIVGIIRFLLKKRPIWAEKRIVKATTELLKNIEIFAYSVFMSTT